MLIITQYNKCFYVILNSSKRITLIEIYKFEVVKDITETDSLCVVGDYL